MNKIIKLTVALTLIVSVITSLVGCNDCNHTSDYKDGTPVRICVKDGSVVFSELGEDGITLKDGVTYHNGDLKPVWESISAKLGISILPADRYSADVVIADNSVLREMSASLLDLSSYADRLPTLWSYLDSNPFVYLSAISDPDVGSMYFAPTAMGDSTGRAVAMRADWIRTLLDGEGDFAAESCGVLDYYEYKPYGNTRASVTVPIYDGEAVQSVVKKYSAGGNVIYTMNLQMDHGTLDGVTAVNILRKYIDEAYGGFYGETRSELFLGERAAWDADELVALLRCIYTNAYTLTGEDRVTPLFFDTDREADILAFAGALFGARGLARDGDRHFVTATGSVGDARAESVTYDAVEAMNSIINEGLVSRDSQDGAVTYRYVLDGKYDLCEDYVLTLPPLAHWDNGTVGGEYLRFSESAGLLGDSGIAISSGVACDRDLLGAALALVDYVYSAEGQSLVTYGSTSVGVTADAIYSQRELCGASYLSFDSSSLAYGMLTPNARAGVDMLARMRLAGIAFTDKPAFTEDPWLSTPFDNLDSGLSDTYPGLTDDSCWKYCYDSDPLLDVALHGYTDDTVSREDMRTKFEDELSLDTYIDALCDLHERLLVCYKRQKK